MTRLLSASLVAGLAAAALTVASAPHALAQTSPAKVDPGTYKVEPSHTQIEFSVLHMGFTNFYGRFTDASGTLVLSPKTPYASKLDVSIPVNTVSTTSDKLNDELKSPAWFDAKAFPQIVFHSTRVVLAGKGAAKVIGDLTLHGVTKPVTLDVHFVGAGINPLDKAYTVGFRATGEISRSAFGVKTYVPMIGDAVQITLSGAFEKQS